MQVSDERRLPRPPRPAHLLREWLHIFGDGRAVSFREELLDQPLGLVVAALAERMMADAAIGADEIDRRPGLIVERPPDREVIVDHDGVADAERDRCFQHIAGIPLEGEFRCVHADHHKSALTNHLVHDASRDAITTGPDGRVTATASKNHRGVSPRGQRPRHRRLACNPRRRCCPD
jgi:hypothetical protein